MELAGQLESVAYWSKKCSTQMENGYNTNGFDDDIRTDDSEEEVTETTKKKCGNESVLHDSLVKLKNITGLDFELETLENEKVINAKVSESNAQEALALEQKTKEENEIKAQKKKTDDYNNSPESFYNPMCSFVSMRKGYEKYIAREKKAAKISGVVDQKALYDYGKKILSMDDLIDNISENYKTKFKKNIDRNKCVCVNDNKAILGISCSVK